MLFKLNYYKKKEVKEILSDILKKKKILLCKGWYFI